MKNSMDMGSLENLATPKIEVSETNVDVLQHPEYIQLLTSELVLNYEAIVDSRGGKFKITELEMFKFFLTALYYRVSYVRADKNKFKYKSFVQYEVHPHILGVLVANIGKAYDEQTGIDLRPQIDDELVIKVDEIETKISDFIFSEEEYLKVCRQLKALRTLGISIGDELPADKNGDFMTLSFACIEGDLKREDSRAHPTQALIAMIAGVNLAESVITPRITYISEDRVNTLIRATAQFELPKNK